MKDNIYNNVKWKRNVGYLQQCEVEMKCGKYTQYMYGVRSVGNARKLWEKSKNRKIYRNFIFWQKYQKYILHISVSWTFHKKRKKICANCQKNNKKAEKIMKKEWHKSKPETKKIVNYDKVSIAKLKGLWYSIHCEVIKR